MRAELERLVNWLMPVYQIPEKDKVTLEVRVQQLAALHGDIDDCRIVAEAELFGVSTLLTFDKKLQKRLVKAAAVEILAPSEQWERLAIPRGTPQLRSPRPENPLRHERFWRLD